ncbi:hypothetical protein [Sunxiuqinia indica]|uniref:hypothetical protein n=1 Tax=Sunxiuqinia indica TaxID=2692584 RepID=UPI0013599F66|nr:hypothetical protein [Sunxiuqinia indica]
MNRSYFYHISLLLLTFILVNPASAQKDSTKLRQEVEVVKAYQPSVSDAFKINDIPQIKDDKREKPTFDYKINSQPVFSTFEVEPVQAAQMVGEPQAKLGKGLLKAGVGNYQTPYGELFYNTKTGKHAVLGMHFKHLSSHGSVKLANEDKVDAPRSENVAELFTKHFFRRSTLSTKLFYERDAHSYYGYVGEQLSDSDKEILLTNWNDKQAFSKGGLQVQLSNEEDTRADLNYDLNLYYHYFGTKTGQTENLVNLGTSLRREFDEFYGLLGISVGYLKTDSIFNQTSLDYGQKQQILLNLSPAILFEGDMAKLQLGVHTFTLLDDDEDGSFLITPNIKAQWSPVENIMTLFVGADGRLQQNHYSAIAAENRFVNPYQDIKNSKYQYILSGGIKGKFSPRLNYRFQADYSSIKDEHFYIFNTTQYVIEPSPIVDPVIQPRSNTFDVLYDDVQQFTLGAEFYYTASDLVNFHLDGKMHSYALDSLKEAWNRPEFELTISTILNPEGPLKFNADIFFMGERKALERVEYLDTSSSDPAIPANTIYTLSSYIDLNFGVEYQYSPQLSFFGRANNFAFQKYENWLGYTQQSFNLLVGASFSF